MKCVRQHMRPASCSLASASPKPAKKGAGSAGVCLPHSWQVVHGLQRGALAGNMPTVMMWRMCTSSNQQQATQVRPSLGGMLAAILLQKVPRKRQQVCPKLLLLVVLLLRSSIFMLVQLQWAGSCCTLRCLWPWFAGGPARMAPADQVSSSAEGQGTQDADGSAAECGAAAAAAGSVLLADVHRLLHLPTPAAAAAHIPPHLWCV